MRPRHPCRVAGCTEPQVRAFEELAKGKRTWAHTRTLIALEGHGLIERDACGGWRAVSGAVDGWRRWCALRSSWRRVGEGIVDVAASDDADKRAAGSGSGDCAG